MTPTTETELAEAIATAKEPLKIIGGGTRPVGKTSATQVISTAALSGITLYEPGALTLVAKAGTPVAEVEAALAAEGQCLPFEPMDHRTLLGTAGTPTIGGVVAANVSGPRRLQAGACRDSLIGVRFVDGRGAILKNGGRVMKNVTGYDLVKLMAGSHGTLGVLSEVSFKVLPASESRAVLTLTGLEDGAAIRALSDALKSPFEVTGATHIPAFSGEVAKTILRLEGMAASVTYRVHALKHVLAGFGTAEVETDPDTCAGIWKQVRDVEGLATEAGDIWKISVKPSDAPELVAQLGAQQVLYDWGGGLVWARLAEGSDVRAAMGATAGHATLVRSAASGIAAFHPEPTQIGALNVGIRAQFDPRGILNPGLMG